MNVSLRIVLKHAAIDVLLPGATALSIFSRWVQRDYQLKGEQVVHGHDLYGYSYAVKVDEISGLFVMPMPTNAPAPERQAPALPGNWQARRDLSGTIPR